MAPAILVADDDFDTRIILRTVLERHHCSVVEAATGDAALAAVQEKRFDLVILNHPMMTADGRTLVQVLRQAPNGRDCPVLNVTSRVVPRFFEQAAEQGVNFSLAKPIDVTSFLRIVDNLAGLPAL